MRTNHFSLTAGILAATAWLAFAPIAVADRAVVGSDISGGFKSAEIVLGNGTTTLFVYSYRSKYLGNPPGIPAEGAEGPNSGSAHFVPPRDQNIPDVARPILQATNGGQTVNIIIGDQSYGPSLTAGPQPKRLHAQATGQNAYSDSPAAVGKKVTGQAAFSFEGGGQQRDKPYFSAGGYTDNERTQGRAAGIAYDPIPTYPGTYEYGHEIHVEMQPQSSGDSLGVKFLANDSRFPSAPLWTLLITASGSLDGPEDLDVQFSINPSALVDPDGQGSLTPVLFDFQNGQQGTINIAAIESAVRNGFMFTSGSNGATLDWMELFPTTTRYYVDSLRDYEFGTAAGLTTGGTAVPTVSEWGLGALAVLLLSGVALKFGRRRGGGAAG